MQRVGKYFEFGYPHFHRGIEYNWPNQDVKFGELIEGKREELGEFLITKTREYMQQFSGKSPKLYPYLQTGMRGLCLHIGDGGRWIEVWKMMGAGFIGAHNLDAYLDRAVAFNVGSDTIEFFDPSILTPRVSKTDKYEIIYPLPDGMKVITPHRHLNQETIERLFGIMKLETKLQVDLNSDKQEITSQQGKIRVYDRICKVSDFEGFNVTKASWIAATLMTLCKP